ncbi:MAG: glucose-6-phosphate isomerase [Actinobacteria bacterium]|nr:glucose-6-phosphate isomerase [Actinomycetota bacterium]
MIKNAMWLLQIPFCGSSAAPCATKFAHMNEITADQLRDLSSVAQRVKPLSDLFAADPHRANWMTVDACGIHADFSRQSIDADLFSASLELVQHVDVAAHFAAMNQGDILNVTENRAVGHLSLRAPASSSPLAALANEQLLKALALAEQVRVERRFTTIVNIGIGGSDLGPAMAFRALRSFVDGPHCLFVSNVDAADLDAALAGLSPESTLFVVSSKTFTTLETMHNAERARAWVQAATTADWSQHFVATTANPEAAQAWGITAENCLQFFDWVGGRYSVSSVIGFTLMCAIGEKQFRTFLLGMHHMDQHAIAVEPSKNLVVLHALTWWINSVVHQHPTVAVIPYSYDLGRLPAYLQQLVMESNGKSVHADGSLIHGSSSPVVWGEAGTNGQHAFFQMLHQGTQVVPVEFVSTVAALGSDQRAHDLLIANMFAQSEALAVGSVQENSHKNFPGNRPSTVLMLDALTPHTFGALLSLYENSTAVQGWLMGVNSFDQWGVELGKTMATSASAAIDAGVPDASQTMTHPLMSWYLQQRKKLD